MKNTISRSIVFAMGFAALPFLAQAAKVMVLPLSIDTSRIHDHKVVQDFFYEAVDQISGGEAVRGKSDSLCAEKECAMAIAKAAKTEQVIFGSVRFLGRKCFFSATIMGPGGENPFSQTINLLGVADFENGTKRMAEALLHRATIEKVANIDNITEKEETVLASRRRSFYSIGGSVGYMYPLNGSYHRWMVDEMDWNCTARDSLGNCAAEDESHTQMIVLGWDNWFEFTHSLAMELNFTWTVPMAVGMDVDLDYLIGKSDFTPFLGGGLGLHYVTADEGIHKDNEKLNSGPTLNFQGGMIFFRTYTVNLVVKGSYHIILNSDKDNGAGLDIGLRTKF